MPIQLSSTYRPRKARIRRRILGVAADTAMFLLSGFCAFELRFDGVIPHPYGASVRAALAFWAIAKTAVFVAGRLDRQSWRETSPSDAVRLISANTIGAVGADMAILLVPGMGSIPRSVYILDWLISSLLILGSRQLLRAVLAARKAQSKKGDCTRTLIYGAGAAGLALLWETRQNPALQCDVVGFIDDDPSKAHLILQGTRVLGTGEDLAAVAGRYAIKRIFIAIPSATSTQMVRILGYAVDAGLEYKMVPGLGELILDAGLGKQLRDVSVEDLLGRKQVHLELESIRKRIQGKVVMVTGAAGSIGSEICRQVARFNPAALVGFDEAETPLFHIERELRNSSPDLAFHAEIGSITDPLSLRCVMRRFKPSVVYHAAAYKHVPMMERHVFAAVENNIFGTANVARAAIAHDVDDFVMISTDKAVRPTSMMGATKRVAELVIRSQQRSRGTRFVAVRFGNVLGSNGSVVPIFKEQIAAGGPVTVTHPEITRYFMTIPEAAQLVLQAHSLGKGGEVFVLDMGEPVKIVDLARNLILLSGLQPDRDIKIQFSGLRPGEKLFEELNHQDESLVPTSHAQIRSFVSSTDNCGEKQMSAYLQALQLIANERDMGCLLLLLKEMVPEYNPGAHLLRAALTVKAGANAPSPLVNGGIPSGFEKNTAQVN